MGPEDRQTKMKEIPAFIIDDSALRNMFEGKNKGKSNDLIKKLKTAKDEGKTVIAVTTLAAFQRAIYLSDPKVKIGKIQKMLSFMKVYPSFADFKDGDAVRKEIIQFAEMMSKKGRKTEEDLQ